MKFFTPERLYAFVMFILSLVLAGFLTGLGGLVIGDLPRVEGRLTIDAFVDNKAIEAVEGAGDVLRRQQAELEEKQSLAMQGVSDARLSYQFGNEAFQSWAKTRRTTGDDSQNAELLRRSAELDILRATREETQKSLALIKGDLKSVQGELTEQNRQKQQLYATARPLLERAQFWQTARIFGFRLAITLPLMLISFWFVRTKRQSRYWPMFRGFVIFSLFAFFVELVPYLPSYGGYFRYIIGAGVTLLGGHYLVRWMRNYLEDRRRERHISEKQRRMALDFDTAVKFTSKGICPGCKRSVQTVDDTSADFCAHCGMMLYENCQSCTTRKLVFHYYCLKCGVKSSDLDAVSDGSEGHTV